jgi:hypothetical protein
VRICGRRGCHVLELSFRSGRTEVGVTVCAPVRLQEVWNCTRNARVRSRDVDAAVCGRRRRFQSCMTAGSVL